MARLNNVEYKKYGEPIKIDLYMHNAKKWKLWKLKNDSDLNTFFMFCLSSEIFSTEYAYLYPDDELQNVIFQIEEAKATDKFKKIRNSSNVMPDENYYELIAEFDTYQDFLNTVQDKCPEHMI
ncbi:hypothetical protein WCWAEYFT_CDS0113 [Vibrio phage VB_VaC_TDDLMA]